MHWIELTVQAICIGLEAGLIVCLSRWGGWREVPVFLAYLVFILLRTIIGSIALSHEAFYYEFYWISAPLEIGLTVLAVLESFWRVFASFRLLRWFRLVLPASVVAALAYAAWRGYHYDRFPLVEMTPAAAALVSATVMLQYAVLGVALLYFLLRALLRVGGRTHENRFILGFGVASLAAAFGGSMRGMFGESFGLVSRESQSVGYLIALLLWLSGAIYPFSDRPASATPPQDFMGDLKFQLRNLRSFVRKGAR
jgi:hypothetical protein